MTYITETINECLNFTIDDFKNVKSGNWDYPTLSVKSLNLVFPDYSDLSDFLYCMKKQSEFDTSCEPNSNTIDISGLKKNIAFDSAMNIISNRKSEEASTFKRDIDRYHRLHEKAFYGTYIDYETVEIKASSKKEILKYTITKSDENHKKVIITPPNTDRTESFQAYVNTDLRPNKSLVVSYIFEKKDDDLIFASVHKNDWIF